MKTIAAVLKISPEGEEYFEAVEAIPDTATSIVFNGTEYTVYEGDEPVVGE